MWTYHQSTGALHRDDGQLVMVGYSGHAEGLNNPDLEHVRNVGPIPRGDWTIGKAFHHPSKGPVCMRLTPAGDIHGRDGFLCHGDNNKGDRSASNGCIIMPRAVRNAIDKSPDKHLRVVR